MVILIFNYLWIEDNSNADKTDLLRKDADKNGLFNLPMLLNFTLVSIIK
jgi:hypothetical protein